MKHLIIKYEQNHAKTNIEFLNLINALNHT